MHCCKTFNSDANRGFVSKKKIKNMREYFRKEVKKIKTEVALEVYRTNLLYGTIFLLFTREQEIPLNFKYFFSSFRNCAILCMALVNS